MEQPGVFWRKYGSAIAVLTFFSILIRRVEHRTSRLVHVPDHDPAIPTPDSRRRPHEIFGEGFCRIQALESDKIEAIMRTGELEGSVFCMMEHTCQYHFVPDLGMLQSSGNDVTVIQQLVCIKT